MKKYVVGFPKIRLSKKMSISKNGFRKSYCFRSGEFECNVFGLQFRCFFIETTRTNVMFEKVFKRLKKMQKKLNEQMKGMMGKKGKKKGGKGTLTKNQTNENLNINKRNIKKVK